jgi:signal transduction histidine kinase
MRGPSNTGAEAAAFDGRRILLEQVHSPVAVCTDRGMLVGASPPARELLELAGMPARELPQPLPAELWSRLSSVPVAQAIEWWGRPRETSAVCIGCAHYRLGARHHLLLMREVSDKHQELSRRLHQQRLEVTGALMATIAHDLRTPLSSLVFNADVLLHRIGELPPEETERTLREMNEAAGRLRSTVNGLLEFGRLGSPVSTRVDLAETVDRVSSFLRPVLRDGPHAVRASVVEDARFVVGNPLVVEQILVNLLVNAAQASERPVEIRIETSRARGDDGEDRVCVRVSDDGPGIPEPVACRVFEPFYTTKADGTGLGLPMAREAAHSLGGDLVLERSAPGASFALCLPAAGDEEAAE